MHELKLQLLIMIVLIGSIVWLSVLISKKRQENYVDFNLIGRWDADSCGLTGGTFHPETKLCICWNGKDAGSPPYGNCEPQSWTQDVAQILGQK